MKKSFFDRRIPTVMALLILLGGLVVTSVLIRQGVFTVSQASPEQEPQNVHVINATDTSFTLAFTTNAPTVAAVNIQNTNPPTLVYDKRDTSGNTPYLTHFITVNSLTPETNYTFSILSDGKNYLDQGKLYSVTTSKTTTNVSDTYPLSGSVIAPDGTPGSDTLVLFSIPNTIPVGTVTDAQGNYRISANNIREKNTLEPIAISPKTPINITAQQKNAVSQITYEYVPGEVIPPITLSQNYSFVASEEIEVSTDAASLLALPTSTQRNTTLAILAPKPNQAFIDARPQFRGTASPNTTVRLVITSEKNIEAQIRSDSLGNWAFRPSTSIAPGTRTITASQTSPTSQRSVSFQVFASGSQIAESATPSASLTPTITAAPTSTPIPSLSPSISSGITTTPTPSIVVTPTAVLLTSVATPIPTTPVAIATSSPQQGQLPPTGDNTAAIILTTLSILFIVTGSAFLFML
ncbi:MAG: hypothetical protein KA035_01630 [Candidatus Levybacteria bacterium]|nr:hypothetical protein [Candidatus Levybacteria bacterium]